MGLLPGNALDQLQPADLQRICYIRNEGHTVLEAINRQFGHYPYHVGQIVFAAKQLKAGPVEESFHSEESVAERSMPRSFPWRSGGRAFSTRKSR